MERAEETPVVYDQFFRPPVEQEMNDGICDVETAGYIPANVQIEQMIAAGERLGTYRKELYDVDVPVDDLDLDPTRTPNFDMADASKIQQSIKGRLAEQKAAAAETAKQAAIEAAKVQSVQSGEGKV